MAVHGPARADHHVKAARHTGKSSPAGRIATTRNRKAADLRAGDLGLICIAAASLPVYASGVLSPKLAEFLSIAVDASITHMYAPGTRRHIQSALKLGATVEEIMEVLKICVALGIEACDLGIPILAEELRA